MTKKSFLLLSRDEQADVVRPLMKDGGSYGSVAKKFNVGRGRIMGICRDFDIPSKNPSGFEALPKSSSGRVLKLSPPGPTQCEAKDEKGFQCAFVKESEHYCGLPAHQKLERGRR